jgi:hypothetical protein
MSAQAIRVFQPDRKAKIWQTINIFLVIIILAGLLGYMLSNGLEIIAILLFVLIAIYSLNFSSFYEKVTITGHGVEQTNLREKQYILLNEIRSVQIITKKLSFIDWVIEIVILLMSAASQGGGSGGLMQSSQLLIKTAESEFTIGFGLRYGQLSEASAYILEQIRIHYPENYARMQDEKRQKEQEAVAEFWSK